MQLSNLIQELQVVMDKHGDLPIVTSMYSDRDFSHTFDDFKIDFNDCTYELEEGGELEEYIGYRENIFGNVLVINHGEY